MHALVSSGGGAHRRQSTPWVFTDASEAPIHLLLLYNTVTAREN